MAASVSMCACPAPLAFAATAQARQVGGASWVSLGEHRLQATRPGINAGSFLHAQAPFTEAHVRSSWGGLIMKWIAGILRR